MLLVWGLSILTWQPKIKHVPTYSDEEGVGFCGNILNPTAWELIQKIVTGPIGCSFAAIIAAFVGFMLALACTLSLISGKNKIIEPPFKPPLASFPEPR